MLETGTVNSRRIFFIEEQRMGQKIADKNSTAAELN
jgi:hypothetical protein